MPTARPFFRAFWKSSIRRPRIRPRSSSASRKTSRCVPGDAHLPGLVEGDGLRGRPAVDEEEPPVLDRLQEDPHQVALGREPRAHVVVRARGEGDAVVAGLERGHDGRFRHHGHDQPFGVRHGLVIVDGLEREVEQDLEPALVGQAGRLGRVGAVGQDRHRDVPAQGDELVEDLEARAHVVHDQGDLAARRLPGRRLFCGDDDGRFDRQDERDGRVLLGRPAERPEDLGLVLAGRPLLVEDADALGLEGLLDGGADGFVELRRDLDLEQRASLRPLEPEDGILGDAGRGQARGQDLLEGLDGRLRRLAPERASPTFVQPVGLRFGGRGRAAPPRRPLPSGPRRRRRRRTARPAAPRRSRGAGRREGRTPSG